MAEADAGVAEAAARIEGLLSDSGDPFAERRRDAGGRYAGQGGAEPAAPEPTRDPEPDEGADTAAADADGGQDDGDRDPAGDGLPPIEAPGSWNDAEKEVFRTLPRAAQEAIQRRERDRDAEVRRRQNELADQRKSFDGERTAKITEATNLAQQLSGLLDVFQGQFMQEFADIKTAADAARLATEAPDRFVQFQAKAMMLQDAHAKRNAAIAAAQQEHTDRLRELARQESERLLDAIPDWKDAKKAKAERTELRGFLIDAGYAEQEVDGVIDHRTIVVARKAMLWDRAQKAAAGKRVADLPPVLKPGAPERGRQAAGSERTKSLMDKARRTGRVEDAAAAIERLIN